MHLTLIPSFAAIMYVWWTQHALPAVVASHFDIQGRPDAFLERSAYVTLMMILMAALPLGAALLAALFQKLPAQAINIPQRDYWLSEERRPESLRYLSGWLQSLSLLVVALLAFVHWLVLRANQHVPAQLESTPMLIGMGVFLAGLAAWLLALYRRFRQPAE